MNDKSEGERKSRKVDKREEIMRHSHSPDLGDLRCADFTAQQLEDVDGSIQVDRTDGGRRIDV